jgi:hypothetical protein
MAKRRRDVERPDGEVRTRLLAGVANELEARFPLPRVITPSCRGLDGQLPLSHRPGTSLGLGWRGRPARDADRDEGCERDLLQNHSPWGDASLAWTASLPPHLDLPRPQFRSRPSRDPGDPQALRLLTASQFTASRASSSQRFHRNDLKGGKLHPARPELHPAPAPDVLPRRRRVPEHHRAGVHPASKTLVDKRMRDPEGFELADRRLDIFMGTRLYDSRPCSPSSIETLAGKGSGGATETSRHHSASRVLGMIVGLPTKPDVGKEALIRCPRLLVASRRIGRTCKAAAFEGCHPRFHPAVRGRVLPGTARGCR